MMKGTYQITRLLKALREPVGFLTILMFYVSLILGPAARAQGSGGTPSLTNTTIDVKTMIPFGTYPKNMDPSLYGRMDWVLQAAKQAVPEVLSNLRSGAYWADELEQMAMAIVAVLVVVLLLRLVVGIVTAALSAETAGALSFTIAAGQTAVTGVMAFLGLDQAVVMAAVGAATVLTPVCQGIETAWNSNGDKGIISRAAHQIASGFSGLTVALFAGFAGIVTKYGTPMLWKVLEGTKFASFVSRAGVNLKRFVVAVAAGCCFAAGTPVQMADGHIKPIERVYRGDLVRSLNLTTGVEEAKPVVCVSSFHTNRLVVLSLGSATASGASDTITCTPEHPFLSSQNQFIEARLLQHGSSLAGGDRALSVRSIRAVESRLNCVVYSLAVADNHTYYVGRLSGGVCVHNTPCHEYENVILALGRSNRTDLQKLGSDLIDYLTDPTQATRELSAQKGFDYATSRGQTVLVEDPLIKQIQRKLGLGQKRVVDSVAHDDSGLFFYECKPHLQDTYVEDCLGPNGKFEMSIQAMERLFGYEEGSRIAAVTMPPVQELVITYSESYTLGNFQVVDGFLLDKAGALVKERNLPIRVVKLP